MRIDYSPYPYNVYYSFVEIVCIMYIPFSQYFYVFFPIAFYAIRVRQS